MSCCGTFSFKYNTVGDKRFFKCSLYWNLSASWMRIRTGMCPKCNSVKILFVVEETETQRGEVTQFTRSEMSPQWSFQLVHLIRLMVCYADELCCLESFTLPCFLLLCSFSPLHFTIVNIPGTQDDGENGVQNQNVKLKAVKEIAMQRRVAAKNRWDKNKAEKVTTPPQKAISHTSSLLGKLQMIINEHQDLEGVTDSLLNRLNWGISHNLPFVFQSL